jgi:Mg2+/Co2+ transporter CorC
VQNPKKPSTFLRPGWWQDLYYLLRGIPQTREHLFSTLDVARRADLVDDDTLQMMRRVIEVSAGNYRVGALALSGDGRRQGRCGGYPAGQGFTASPAAERR